VIVTFVNGKWFKSQQPRTDMPVQFDDFSKNFTSLNSDAGILARLFFSD
jgi:hypothetical protein